MKLTSISELGEFKLIEHLTKNIEIQNTSTIMGIGDDAAILNFRGKNTVISTDLLIEGIHFDMSYVPLKHLGYKAIAVNISDIYAMNAIPTQVTVSIAVSNRFPVEALDEFYDGIKVACKNHKVDFVGGDTSSSKTGFIISVTALGIAENDKVVKRSTAQVDDIVCVTGDLGGAYVGLQLLEREKEIYKTSPNLQPELTGNEYILQRQLRPEPRKDIIEAFAELEIIPTAMMDISDGLSSELMHICNQSGVGCRIYEEKIPIAKETIKQSQEFNIDPTVCAMNGGEDYELVFTISVSDYEKIKNNWDFTAIGYITKDTGVTQLIARDGTAIPIEAQGWNTFK